MLREGLSHSWDFQTAVLPATIMGDLLLRAAGLATDHRIQRNKLTPLHRQRWYHPFGYPLATPVRPAASGLLGATFIAQPWHLYLTLGVLIDGSANCMSYTAQSLFLPHWFAPGALATLAIWLAAPRHVRLVPGRIQ